MRKLIVEAEVSMDGVYGGEAFFPRVFPLHSEDVSAYLRGLMDEADALVMGRVTYESFADYWPAQTGPEAVRLNELPKYVASRTLKGPLSWNAQLLEEDVAKSVASLKELPGINILQFGVGELTRTLIDHSLVDELHLLVYPFAMGEGPRIFAGNPTPPMSLLNLRAFDSGAIVKVLAPAVDT